MKQSLSVIKEAFSTTPKEFWESLLAEYAEDERKSVQDFLNRCRKTLEKEKAELERLENLCRYEKEYAEYELSVESMR